jgi:hypothetical protein
MIRDRCQAIGRSKWLLPLFSFGLGAIVLLAGWLGAIGGLAYLISVAFLRWRG